MLNNLEIQGAIYCDKHNLYTLFPDKLILSRLKIDKKGHYFVVYRFRTMFEDAYEEEIYEEEDPICIETDNAKPALLYPQTNRTTNNTHRIFPTGFHRNNNNRTTNYRTNTLSNTHRTLDAGSIRNPVKFNVDLENLFEFFKNHSTIFLLLLIILCTLITYALNVITVGPYTGVGKILSCVILCYGGVALINKDLSDILFKGSVLFFISIIISIFTAKL